MRDRYSLDRSKDLRRVKPEIIVFVLLVLLFSAILIYVYLDLSRRDITVDNSRNPVVLSAVDEEAYPYKTVETQTFSVDVPVPWIRVTNPEIRVAGSRYYPVRYQGVEGIETGRRLDVYIDVIPAKLPVNKIWLVNVQDEDRIVARELSPQCYTFTDHPLQQKGEPFDSSWQGHTFTCLTARQSNLIATVETHYQNNLLLSGPNSGERKVMLVFTDHSANANNNIFKRIMESFRLK